jgi:hypothetical protein
VPYALRLVAFDFGHTLVDERFPLDADVLGAPALGIRIVWLSGERVPEQRRYGL